VGAGALPVRATLAAALAAAFVALPAASATAQDVPKPEPGCAGTTFTDPRGDQVDDPTGLGVGAKGGDNVDVTSGFFRYDAGVLTANIQVANLTLDVPADATGVVYYFYFAIGSTLHWVNAESDGTSVAFNFGTLDPNTGVFTLQGATEGRLFLGPDGIVQIKVPPATGATPGTVLGTPFAESDSQLLVLIAVADQGPDGGRGGATYTVGECSSAPAPSPAPTAPSKLPFRAPSSLGSARKANAAKAIVFKGRATKPITDLKVLLRGRSGKGSILASGGLARISGTKTVRLRVKHRLRKGTYTLKASGIVGARRLAVTRRVTLST
jgi:hypothetical protein